ncbi:MAG TPA: GNAT family N-acetyltransferase [Anaerolineales bacterium]|nr:GNAT family N-acetyltransferase [Anaerolineales bacterium]
MATRHLQNRIQLPLLPQRFEDPDVTRSAIEALWKEKLQGGYAAFRNGQMVAYLLGQRSTNSWGRSGTVYLPGYAVAPGESATILQDLYARLGEDWIKAGHFSHYIYISAADEDVIEALFNIGFGKERVDALLNLQTLQIPDVQEPAGIHIRRAVAGDNALVGSFSNVIFRALAKPPYWHPTMPEDWDDLREGWSELPDEKEWTVWLALDQEEALSTIGFRPEEEADTQMLASPQTIYLSVAATKPQARGRGINTALTWHGLKQARDDGYKICYTNWISPNLLASRFWPRFGFQDVSYRLAKKVNPMIAWAKDE